MSETAAPATGTVTAPGTEAEKLEQTVTLEDAGPAQKKITIEIPESRIKEKIEDSFGSLRDDAVLPGFRRGRAPRRLLEKRFSESIRGEVKNQILAESYQQAIEEHELDVIGEPDVADIETLELPESGPLTFTVEVEVTPDVKLPDFKTIKVDTPEVEVTDEDVTKETEALRERFGKMDQVEDATIGEGDYVQCDLKVLKGEDAGDDAEVLEEREDIYTLIHGEKDDYKGHIAGIVVDDLGKRLDGKNAGHVERVSKTGPKSHENEAIREQPITLVITTKNVSRLQPAEVSTLVEQMGVETEDEFNDRLREMLQQRKVQEATTTMRQQASEQLVEAVTLELPEGLKDRQIQRTLQRRQMELQYAGASAEQVESQMAEAREQSEEAAIQQLKTFFVLNKAAHDLDIEVDQNEINGRIAMMAMQQGRRPEKMRQEMMQQGQIEQLYLSIREAKTLDKVLEAAGAELPKAPEAADAADAPDAPDAPEASEAPALEAAEDEQAETEPETKPETKAETKAEETAD
jgi:trigger factor